MPTPTTRGSHLNAPDYADRVNLIEIIKVDGAWRFAPEVPEPSGRLKDKVRINGTVETHPEGAYYIEWRERGKRCRVSVARKRTGHNKLRFGDNLGRQGDRCTAPNCYAAKVSAHVAQAVAAKPELVQISTAYGAQ